MQYRSVKNKISLVAFLVLWVFTACQTDSYDKGQGELSLTQAGFVVAHAGSDKRIDRGQTDEGRTLTVSSPLEAKWITTPDSLYRAIFYYDFVGESETLVAPKAISAVPTLTPLLPEDYRDGVKTDPVKFESLWLSANGSYVNMGFYIKVGQTDSDEARHVVGLVLDRTTVNADRTRTAWLRFYHDQGGVPEYYSSRYYVSIPTDKIDADSICLTVHTYEGDVVKRLRVK